MKDKDIVNAWNELNQHLDDKSKVHIGIDTIHCGRTIQKTIIFLARDRFMTLEPNASARGEARTWARNFDYDTRIIPQWINLLNSLNPDEIMMKGF